MLIMTKTDQRNISNLIRLTEMNSKISFLVDVQRTKKFYTASDKTIISNYFRLTESEMTDQAEIAPTTGNATQFANAGTTIVNNIEQQGKQLSAAIMDSADKKPGLFEYLKAKISAITSSKEEIKTNYANFRTEEAASMKGVKIGHAAKGIKHAAQPKYNGSAGDFRKADVDSMKGTGHKYEAGGSKMDAETQTQHDQVLHGKSLFAKIGASIGGAFAALKAIIAKGLVAVGMSSGVAAAITPYIAIGGILAAIFILYKLFKLIVAAVRKWLTGGVSDEQIQKEAQALAKTSLQKQKEAAMKIKNPQQKQKVLAQIAEKERKLKESFAH